MKKKSIFILISIFVIGTISFFMSNNHVFKDLNKENKNPQLVYASTKDIRDINPHLYKGELAAQNMVFEPLVINSREGIKPYLAKSWNISADGLRYIFKLRENVKFTDGSKFNAKAVKLNFDAIIQNKERHAWLDAVKKIDSTKIIDEYTFEIKLKTPYYPFLTELALTRPFRFISPKCFINGKTKNGVNNYYGTGPYLLHEHKNDQYSLFIKNKDYWGEKPKIESIKWKVMPDHQTILLALEKGEIDLIFGADGDMINIDSFNALREEGKYKTLLSKPIASRSILLNSNKSFTKTRKFREAIHHAVNKEVISKGILNGSEMVADTLFSKTIEYADLDLEKRKYNQEKANQILDNLGWKYQDDGYRYANGSRCEIVFSFNMDNAQEKIIAEYIQNNLKHIGIKVKLLGEETQAFLDRQKTGDFHLQYSLSWGVPYDPQSYLSSWRIPSHGDYQAQIGLEKKEWLDNNITKIMTETNYEKRKKMYKDILTYIHNEAVYLPLTYSRTKAIYVSELKGVGFNLSQYEIPFKKMYFTK